MPAQKRAEAQQTISAVRTAISAHSLSALDTSTISSDDKDIGAYCGDLVANQT